MLGALITAIKSSVLWEMTFVLASMGYMKPCILLSAIAHVIICLCRVAQRKSCAWVKTSFKVQFGHYLAKDLGPHITLDPSLLICLITILWSQIYRYTTLLSCKRGNKTQFIEWVLDLNRTWVFFASKTYHFYSSFTPSIRQLLFQPFYNKGLNS